MALGVLLGLFAHQGFLLFLRSLEASHKSALFAGLLGVFEHLGTNFFLADAATEDVCLYDCNQQRQEVVVAEAGCVVIEEEQEHHGHQIHHPLHTGHGGPAGLILHIDARVYDVDHGHQQAEQAHMATIERDIEGKRQYHVGCREVVCP